LPAAVAPVVIGTAIAYGDDVYHGASFLAAMLGALLIQVGTNFANDYFDFVKGADTAERIGPARATQSGLVTPATMRRAFLVTFGLALVPGAYIILRGGWPFLLIGLVSITCGVLYTGGPFPLGYLGLGDLFVLVFFGPVAVCGTYYLHALELTPILVMHRATDLVLAGTVPGLVSVALLTINNLRDVEQDRLAGKRTLAVRLGKGFARVEYAACLIIATLALPLYFAAITHKTWLLLGPIVAVPLVLPSIRLVFERAQGPALNVVLGATGRLLLIFSAVFSLGWAL
jgi:1,4-dihydroxy-2-naphthoate octaprenyltransferase